MYSEHEKTLMHDLAAARGRIDELREKIASLEKHLAAPPAQTQQGLSEEEAASLWILLNRPGMTSNKSIALIMERCGRPSNFEKQPSPAAAPAQLSEAIDRFDMLVADYEARSPATRLSAAVKADRKAVNLLRAALAGQPAPTDDQEALRAAALEYGRYLNRPEPRSIHEGLVLLGDLIDAAKALAGSPAQQGQLGKKVAT